MGSAHTRQGSRPLNPYESAKKTRIRYVYHLIQPNSFLTPQPCLNAERFEAEDKRPPRRRGGYKKAVMKKG
uniref:Uncharacterized protein n=1 Tax=Magnetococcus massalia (strain MO-1) TaxID=451514 RepID=A0A1S7LGP8_MAGMO|nr:protein of unknown function [Candidatus Magnetococcus massalia]